MTHKLLFLVALMLTSVHAFEESKKTCFLMHRMTHQKYWNAMTHLITEYVLKDYFGKQSCIQRGHMRSCAIRNHNRAKRYKRKRHTLRSKFQQKSRLLIKKCHRIIHRCEHSIYDMFYPRYRQLVKNLKKIVMQKCTKQRSLKTAKRMRDAYFKEYQKLERKMLRKIYAMFKHDC